MNLQEAYRRIERQLVQIERQMETLEDEGLYGSPQYDKLVEKQTNLEADLEGIEEEMDRD